MKLLHFADAHIDMANYGRQDPLTGLPLRVLDFLKSLDTIVETALSERVDLVIFAGDAYKDRTPAPTFQREWGKRIVRLSQAKIPTLLLVGNHDMSPAVGRAHAIQEFDTLQVPYVKVLGRPQFLKPDALWDLPIQVIALPWITRSGLMANLEMNMEKPEEIFSNIEERISDLVTDWLEQADPSLPTLLTAHASVQGAVYGAERMVMLGADLTLPGSLVKDKRLDYVALGHIHKPQDLNQGQHPPVIYPGSIERVDFSEANDEKFFVIAEVQKGQTQVIWKKLSSVRPFHDRRVILGPARSAFDGSEENVNEVLLAALPSLEEMKDAIVRLTVEYPRELDSLIDEPALRKYAAQAFEFHLVKRPLVEGRIRLPADQTASSLSPLDLLEQYWRASKVSQQEEVAALQSLAQEIMQAEQT